MSDTEASDTSILIEAGSDISGAAAGAALGFLIAGPPGAIGGAAAGEAIGHGIRKVASEIRQRLLSSREEARIGGALAYAVADVQSRFSAGETLRSDGLLEEEVSPGRMATEELLEGTLIVAQQSYSEKKIPYIGKLYADVLFNESLDVPMTHYLLRVADELTYTQFVLLALVTMNFSTDNGLGLREVMFPPEGQSGLVQVGHELFDLAQRGFLSQRIPDQEQGEVILDIPSIKPSLLRVQGMGHQLVTSAQLTSIPTGDLEPIARQLGSSAGFGSSSPTTR